MERDPYKIPNGRVRRAAPLVGLAGRTAGEAVIAALRRKVLPVGGGGAGYKPRGEGSYDRTARRYAEMMGRSKGVLMKAGQIMSFVSFGAAVPDEHRSVYQATLARLQDDAPPMPAELAASVVAEELGRPPSEAFAEFDPVPLAAASIGQVHAARLHDGRRVAVKIQYPGVEEAIRADLENAELLATFFSLIRTLTPDFTRVDVRALAREVADRIGEEIDYVTEARNQAAFADAYRGHPFMRVPEVVPEFSARRVFTTELAGGMRWAQALGADQALRDRWGEAIFRFSLGGLRKLHLFNADPHPGNYLFHDDGSVTFLDFGCVKRFNAEHVTNIQTIVATAIDGDAETMLAVLDRTGFIDPSNPPDAAELLAWFRESFRPLVGPQPFTYTPEFAADVVRSEYSPVGRYSGVTRKLSMRPDYLFLTRVNLGVTALLGALRATGQWEAIRQEWDCDGPPAGPLGELDVAFWEGTNAAR